MEWNSWWKWKLVKLQNWIADRREEVAQRWKGTQVQHKMCPECRGLVDKNAKTCPLCGASLSGVPIGGVTRFISALFPRAGFYTATILAVNLLLYVGMTMVSARRASGSPLNIFGGADNITLINFGADMGYLVQNGQIWRWVTAIFLHAGLLHIGFNSLALYSIGPQLEELYGRSKFIFMYLMTGVAGFAASYYFLPPDAPTVGASGSVFGLIGILAVYGHRRGGSLGQAIKRSMIQWAISALIFGFVIGANNSAHIGGFLAGCALSYLISESPDAGASEAGVWGLLEGLSVLTIIASFALNFANYGNWMRFFR